MDLLGAHLTQGGYNVCAIAGRTTGVKHTPEAKIKMSKIHKGKKLTPEQCQTISNTHKGKPKTQEHREKIGRAQKERPNPLKGRKLTEEQCARKRLIPRTPEWNANIANAHRGKKLSAETIAKISATQKGRPPTEKQREGIARRTASGWKPSPEHMAKARAARGNNVITPETRAKMSEGRRRAIANGQKKQPWSEEHRRNAMAGMARARAAKKADGR